MFAAPYNLRFPRVQRVRYDKPWYDCLDVQSKTLYGNHMSRNLQGPSIGLVADCIRML